MVEQRTCKDRVEAELKGRIADLTKLWELYQEGCEKTDEELGHIDEYGLSFDYIAPGTYEGQEEGYFQYQLSWGGPSDDFRIYVDLEYRPYKIEYWFLDWFDGASINLEGKDFDFIAELFSCLFVDSGTAQAKFEQVER